MVGNRRSSMTLASAFVPLFLPRTVVAVAFAASLAACGSLDLPLTISAPATPAATPGSLSERPTTVRREQLVGRWGVASFRDEKDRNRTEAMARTQCRLPYNITLGPTDGVMMHVADDPKLYELRLKGASNGKTYLGPEAPPGDPLDRELVSIAEKEIVMRFVDPDAHTRYGTFIYVRCA